MTGSLLAPLFDLAINLVSSLGYVGIFLAMAIEAASIPLPSEVIMGIAGYLVYKGEMNLLLAGLIGALGNATGSTIMYVIGSKGGRPVINKYGKYFHIDQEKFDKVDAWFKKFGEKMIFLFQLLPVVRTFISLPLGILKVNFFKFRIYTFIGSFIWCTLLAYISSLFGEEWEKIHEMTKELELILLVLFILVVGIYFGRKYYFKKLKKYRS